MYIYECHSDCFFSCLYTSSFVWAYCQKNHTTYYFFCCFSITENHIYLIRGSMLLSCNQSSGYIKNPEKIYCSPQTLSDTSTQMFSSLQTFCHYFQFIYDRNICTVQGMRIVSCTTFQTVTIPASLIVSVLSCIVWSKNILKTSIDYKGYFNFF